MNKVGNFIRGIIFTVIGALIFVYVIPGISKDWREVRDAQNWVEVPADFISGSVRTKRSTKTLYITYSYTYEGETYISSNAGSYTNEDLRKMGNFVFSLYCYVNPENPSQAVLFRNIEGQSLLKCVFFIGFGLFFVGIGGLYLFSLFKSLEEKPQAPKKR